MIDWKNKTIKIYPSSAISSVNMMLSVKSLLRNALFRSAAKKNSAIFSVSANFTRSAPIAAVNYESAYGVVLVEENPEVAFLGTGFPDPNRSNQTQA